jgi:dihydroorotate dehydrogenase electron transfer subunit
MKTLFPVARAEQFGIYGALTLNAPELCETALPGRFLHLRCGDKMLRRPISICDVRTPFITIVFEIKGEGTQWLAARKVGDLVDVIGPFGHGFPPLEGRVLLAGGGIGAAPLLLTARASSACDAVIGFRSRERALLVDEFEAVCDTVKWMSDDGTFGEKGFVAAGVGEMLAKGSYEAVLACGPMVMLRTVAQACGDTPCYVSMEQRIGCGIGACLVCSCATKDGYRRACKDGPVFDAKEVDWDA